MTNADTSAAQDDDARDYVERAYCGRYEENGWIYDDGALRIDAQRELETGGECGTQRPGEPVMTVPCESLLRTDPTLNCALLRHVRRSDVRVYLDQLDRTVAVRCDDGTPLESLGVP